MVGMMATPNPAKPHCPDGCETLLGNSSTGRVFCAACGNPPISAAERTEDVDARLAEDYLMYGVSYHTVDDQGAKVRIDPTKLIIHLRGVTSEMVEAAKAEQVKPALKQCAEGWGHGGSWCGPKYECWLDPRSRGERKGHPKDCPCRECR